LKIGSAIEDYLRFLRNKKIKKILINQKYYCNFAQIFFDMDTMVEEAKQVEMPKTFASKKVNTMGYVQLNVPISFGQVVDIVRQLSPSDKQQLGEVLWDEQNIDDIVIPEEHKMIVRERIKKYEKTPDSYLSWDDIERKMAARQ
jgi:hypothetical protein